ncbi:MAG: mRNA surveillance protein Pelota, partial [Candidatus Bathyarchaeota archaeon]|nr:mRNA surveillance protein Pelota [Candidatus Bathyarchaeota archaeon]
IGVGFMKSKFAEHLKTEASEIAQSLIDVKGVNNGGVAGIKEALRSGILDKALKHLRISEETRLVEELLARLAGNKGDATYGFDVVRKAGIRGAVKMLLVTDSMLRNASDENRLDLEDLMKGVEEKSGRVVVVSIEHEAGEKLHALSGVAALLRYPIT